MTIIFDCQVNKQILDLTNFCIPPPPLKKINRKWEYLILARQKLQKIGIHEFMPPFKIYILVRKLYLPYTKSEIIYSLPFRERHWPIW